MWASVALPSGLQLPRGRPSGPWFPYPSQAVVRRGERKERGRDNAHSSQEESAFSHRLLELLRPPQFSFPLPPLSSLISEGNPLKPIRDKLPVATGWVPRQWSMPG